VPRSAIRNEGTTAYVFVVRGDAVERRAVRTGGVDGDRVEVLAVLAGGDRVVVSPPDALTNGAHVVIH
jgi:multidrug efflux pump subunit AcrA (membrane-fusion protein)